MVWFSILRFKIKVIFPNKFFGLNNSVKPTQEVVIIRHKRAYIHAGKTQAVQRNLTLNNDIIKKIKKRVSW